MLDRLMRDIEQLESDTAVHELAEEGYDSERLEEEAALSSGGAVTTGRLQPWESGTGPAAA